MEKCLHVWVVLGGRTLHVIQIHLYVQIDLSMSQTQIVLCK